MVGAKRARKAETPKQPSLCLRLRAPQFYPDWIPFCPLPDGGRMVSVYVVIRCELLLPT